MEYLTDQAIDQFITSALNEDVGDGDHSSLAAISQGTTNIAQLIVKDDGILAGVEVALRIFKKVDADLKVEVFIKDGDRVSSGDIAFKVKGSARSILTAERLVLNCMQRMSGIATLTKSMSSQLRGYKTKLLDTRKTTPNFRLMEKWAVKIGGGENHRFALYDMVMLKDNHIDFAGGIPEAIRATKKYLNKKGLKLKIEIETRTLAEVGQVMKEGGVDIIMLDNMMPSTMRQAVALIGNDYITEASGGITEENLREVAECNVDYISVGALTHSVKSLDMSLKAKN